MRLLKEGVPVTDEVNSDSAATLEELDGDDWGEPPYPSHLVTTCHRLRRKPLREFTTEDLRIMIGQKFSLTYLMPLAIDVLERDPLAHGDMEDGDLLRSVMRAPSSFWCDRSDLWSRVLTIVENAERAWVDCDELAGLEPPFESLVGQFIENEPGSIYTCMRACRDVNA
jgi:CDI immunity proteins